MRHALKNRYKKGIFINYISVKMFSSSWVEFHWEMANAICEMAFWKLFYFLCFCLVLDCLVVSNDGWWFSYVFLYACLHVHFHDEKFKKKCVVRRNSLHKVRFFIASVCFYVYRELRCLRNTIHSHLMVTYVLADALWVLSVISSDQVGRKI